MNEDTPRRRRGRSAGYDYLLSACRSFVGVCLLYTFVNLLYALAQVAGIYNGLVIAGGTGTLLGIVTEWLRRRKF